MKKVKIFFIFGVSILLTSANQNEVNFNSENKFIDHRRVEFNKWLNSLQVIKNKINQKSLNLMIDFISTRAILAKPLDDDKLYFFDPVKTGFEIPILVLLREDRIYKETNLACRYFFLDSNKLGGQFFPKPICFIVLNSYFDPKMSFSDLYRGTTFLHEVYHWLNYLIAEEELGPEKSLLKFNNSHAEEEVRTYEFEFRLLDALGNQNYRSLVEAEKKRLRPYFNLENNSSLPGALLAYVETEEYQKFFGNIEIEKNKWLQTIYLDAIFELSDDLYGKKSMSFKKVFYQNIE